MSVAGFESASARNRAIQSRLKLYREWFELKGTDFAKGVLAADQGSAPTWYISAKRGLRHALGIGLVFEAAHQYLKDVGADPLQCGRDFFSKSDPFGS